MKFSIAQFVNVIALAILTGCGGGGGTASTTVDGLVAVGAAVPYATVLLTDANRNVKITYSNALGENSFDISGLKAPFVIKAIGGTGAQVFSLVSALPSTTDGTSNSAQITPLTTAIAALINSNNSYDADTLTPERVNATTVATATSALTSALSAPIKAAGLPTSFNPITQRFAADRKGADQVLDVVEVRTSPQGVILSNRMEVLSETTDPSSLTLANSGTLGTWVEGVTPAGPGLLDLESQIMNCFRLPASQRAPVFTTDSGGFISADIAQIPKRCKEYVVSDYAHNTYNYGERWGEFLSSSNFLNAQVFIRLRYVLAKPGTADGKIYIVNVDIKDIKGNWYTKPEVLERKTDPGNDVFTFYGNRRQIDFGVDANFTYIDDLSTPANSRVEGRLQLNLTPHRAKLLESNKHQFFYDVNTPNLAQPKIICAWITGPMLQTGAVHDIGNPKGGVLVKIPHQDAVLTKNYMPIHAKYSADFDPINNASGTNNDRLTLFNDCKSTTGTGSSVRIGTSGTSSQFTFSAVKANSTSTWTYPGPSANNFFINRVNVATCNGNTTTTTDGCPRRTYPTIRSQETTDQDKLDYIALYGKTSMPRFTIYAFQDDKYVNAESTDYNIWGNNIETFWNSKTIENGRMIGSMAFVERDNNGTYSGNIKFRKPDTSTVSTYLAPNLATLAAGTNVNVGWTVPLYAQGIDRFGGKSQAYFNSAVGGKTTEKVIVSSIAQISKAAPRSETSGVLELSDEWLGNDAIGKNKTYGDINFMVTSVYREIWARSYDLENRQIQYVYTRKN